MSAVNIVALPADLQTLHPVRVNFAQRLELIGLEFDQEYDRLVLRLRWKLLAEIPHRLCCFAHVSDSTQTKVDSMDHELLDGKPPVSEWRPGDEACERLFLQLPDPAARRFQIHIGVYDPETKLRWPIWASTLSAVDEYTAAVVKLGEVPSSEQRFEFPELCSGPCQIIFEKGVELSSYAVSRLDSTTWLRLCWVFRQRPNRHWRFFGHGVTDRSPGSPILVSFDQDLASEQSIVRSCSPGAAEPSEIAAGIFHTGNGRRLRILDSSLPADRETQRVFFPLRIVGQA